MIELGEREATEAVAEKEAAETAAHAALMKEANLEVPYLLVCLTCCIMCVCVCVCVQSTVTRHILNITK